LRKAFEVNRVLFEEKLKYYEDLRDLTLLKLSFVRVVTKMLGRELVARLQNCAK